MRLTCNRARLRKGLVQDTATRSEFGDMEEISGMERGNGRLNDDERLCEPLFDRFARVHRFYRFGAVLQI